MMRSQGGQGSSEGLYNCKSMNDTFSQLLGRRTIFKRSNKMPFIDLKLVGKLTKQQKEIIAKEFSETLLRVAGKPKESTYLVIEEVEGQNWAQGDKFFA